MSSKESLNENSIKIQVMQLASRLEDASSNERLEAIQTLQSLARQNVSCNTFVLKTVVFKLI